jgi:hypothetical protein
VQQRLTRQQLIAVAAVLSYFAMSIVVLLGHSMMIGPLPDVATLQFWTLAILGPLAFFVLGTLLLIGGGAILFLLLNALDPMQPTS